MGLITWEVPSQAGAALPGKRVADFGTNISVDDYFVGKFFLVLLTGDML